MISRWFLLVLILWGTFGFSQGRDIAAEIKKIDNHVVQNRFEIALKTTRELLTKLNRPGHQKHQAEILELKFRMAQIPDRMNVLPSDWLPILHEIKDVVEEKNLHELAFKIYLLTALGYEKTEQYDFTQRYLG